MVVVPLSVHAPKTAGFADMGLLSPPAHPCLNVHRPAIAWGCRALQQH